ncbi:MAG TPA: hypothetical protein VFR14_03090 [Candidatus Limnocylindrales bacterium]|nr:hypothetical protein [Candidatus Limnocylindrales bacterium]
MALALGMAVAGVSHLVSPLPFVQHLPTWIPERYLIVYVSGVIEIALGAALLAPARWRPLVGAALAAYLVAVFPGNVYVAVAGVDVVGQPGGIYAWLRLPLQAVFIWLTLWSTGATSRNQVVTALSQFGSGIIGRRLRPAIDGTR